MLPTIPASAKNVSETSSYNCTLENMFLGASVTIDVDCPTPKIIESTVTELPQTGAGANIVFGGLLLAIVSYFYLRSRQLSTEVRLVRRNVHDGTF
jgi:LPXTG-motif cell wall-anchored protein